MHGAAGVSEGGLRIGFALETRVLVEFALRFRIEVADLDRDVLSQGLDSHCDMDSQ